MCLWFKRKPELDTELDPRSGAKDISVPVPGAFADPEADSPVYTTNYTTIPQTTAQPVSPPQSTATKVEEAPATTKTSDNSSLLRRITITSSGTPAQSPPNSPPLPQQANAQPPSVASTDLSFHSSTSHPNSPQPSPKWTKTSHQEHSISENPELPNERHNSQALTHKSRDAAPSPIPVHAAYIPGDQLSIGAKLSPALTSSMSSTPTTHGPRTGSMSYSQTVSPTSGRNPWRDSSGTMPRNTTPSYSNAVSPIEGRLPFGRESGDGTSPKHLPMGFTMHTSQHNTPGIMNEAQKQETNAIATPPQTPPWERRALPKILTVPAGDGKAGEEGHQQEKEMEKEKRERHRLSLHLPSLKGRKNKQAARTPVENEKSPASAESVEQWPGKF